MGSQNIILNSSFSNVDTSFNAREYIQYLPKKSYVKNWSYPSYIFRSYTKDDYHKNCKNKLSPSGLTYVTARVKRGVNWDCNEPSDSKYFDQEYTDNLGCMEICISKDTYSRDVCLQQKLKFKLDSGRYFLKFKYKIDGISTMSNGDNYPYLDFCFSEGNLSNYYLKKYDVPNKMVQFRFTDTGIYKTYNLPWANVCKVIKLSGKEKYLSIGSLVKNYTNRIGIINFLIDDIELIKINKDNDTCKCDFIKSNINYQNLSRRNFKTGITYMVDTIYNVDTCVGRHAQIINLQEKKLLEQIIIYLHENPKLKINLTYPSSNVNLANGDQLHYFFLQSYGIKIDRILITFSNEAKYKSIECFECRSTPRYKYFGFKFFDD